MPTSPATGRTRSTPPYAIGGPALTITTLKRYLGIDINHVVEVNFVDFPKFIDALGGIDLTFRHKLAPRSAAAPRTAARR